VAEPFLAEIRMVSFSFPPKGWAFCNGQFLPINQFQALFSLLGTTYGGDGQVSFALPDLRARAPVHVGGGLARGEVVGEVFVGQSLSTVSSVAPERGLAANLSITQAVSVPANLAVHDPYLGIGFVIALQGIYPSRD
jgi:microcystin-dependent protein